MKALRLSIIVVLAVAIAIGAMWLSDRAPSKITPGPSTYIQLDHQGSQNKSPPLVRIGTSESLPPPQPTFFINHLPAPINLILAENVAVDVPHFQSAMALTARLKCQDRTTDSWTELTVTVFAHGRLASYCLLDREAARAYVDALNSAVGTSDSPRSALDDIAGFFHSAAYGVPDEPVPPTDTQWTELRHDDAGATPYPAILFGTAAGLAQAAKQHVDDGTTELRLTRSQYQMMELSRHDAMCAADPPGEVFYDDFRITSGDDGTACKTYGEYGCYYLNRLYSLSLPDHAVAGIDEVRTLADRLGCRPEGWGVYSYVDLHPGNQYRATGPIVWVGTATGLPPARPEVSRIIVSDAQYRQLIEGLHQDRCNLGIPPNALSFLIAMPYQDGLRQVDCQLDAANGRAYVNEVISLLGSNVTGAGLDDLHRIAKADAKTSDSASSSR